MKKLILFAFIALPGMLLAQEKYTISGNIGNLGKPAKAYLTYRQAANTITDSTKIKDGAFRFAGEVTDITKAGLVIDYKGTGFNNLDKQTKRGAVTIYLVKGKTLINSPDSLDHATVSGTRINEDNQRYTAFLKPATDARNALYAEYYAATPEKREAKDFSAYIDKKDDSITVCRSRLDSLFIIANPDSYISLEAVKDMAGPEPDINRVQPEFNLLSANLRASKAGAAYQKDIDQLKTVVLGASAPEFAQTDTNGKLVRLSSFRGKYVLIDFWASWCGPCRAENPNVVKAFNNYKNKNFAILGVSLDRPGKKAAWLKAIHTDGLTWTHVSDLKFGDNAVAVLYGIQAIPQNFLLDPDGKIIAKNLYGDDLEKKLAELFGKM